MFSFILLLSIFAQNFQLPDGVIVSKEARQTISRASSVFVLYLTAWYSLNFHNKQTLIDP